MNNIEKYPKCHMRTSLGNCGPIGGFCTSVNEAICKALHRVADRPTGEWEHDVDGHFFCTNCKKYPEYQVRMSDYCPNCGAYMGGKDNE